MSTFATRFLSGEDRKKAEEAIAKLRAAQANPTTENQEELQQEVTDYTEYGNTRQTEIATKITQRRIARVRNDKLPNTAAEAQDFTTTNYRVLETTEPDTGSNVAIIIGGLLLTFLLLYKFL